MPILPRLLARLDALALRALDRKRKTACLTA